MTFVLTTAPGRLTGATMDDSATSSLLARLTVFPAFALPVAS